MDISRVTFFIVFFGVIALVSGLIWFNKDDNTYHQKQLPSNSMCPYIEEAAAEGSYQSQLEYEKFCTG